MTGKPRSWRDIWYYIWKRVDNENDITFNKLYNESFVQQMLAEQFHNIGSDNTKHRFHEMFKDIKRQRGCSEEDEEIAGASEGIDDAGSDNEGEEELAESLFQKRLRQKRQENKFERITESIIHRIR